MGNAAALIELGDRYWALGLPAAARSALARALAATDDVVPALRLADIALAQGDARGARGFAAEAAKRASSPEIKIVLARAQLAAGELTAARMSLLAALDAPKLGAWDRAPRQLGQYRHPVAQRAEAGPAPERAARYEPC